MESTSYNINSDPEFQGILAQASISTAYMSKLFFPTRFNLPFSQIHGEIFKALDDDSLRKVVIAAPRGFGKTSIVNFAYPARRILFRSKKFIVPVSNSATQAIIQSENLKRELATNQETIKIFGPVKAEKVKGISEQFSKEMWITDSKTAVLPRGSGQQVRGILIGDTRPDLIICDDLEDSEGVRNEENRKKMKEWFFSDLMESVSRAHRNWRVIVIGTVLHEDSLLVNLLEDPTWHAIRLELCDDNYRSNWPDLMSDKEVKDLARSFAGQGLLDVFYREYRNIPVATEDAVFKQEYFKHYKETDEDFDERNIESVVIVDPAKTTKVHSAETGIVCWGIDIKNGKMYLRDAIGEKLHPDQIVDRTFEIADFYRARVIGIEKTGLDEFIMYPFRTEMSRRGKSYELIELKATGGPNAKGKERRVEALAPFYRRGLVFHNEQISQNAETQLMAFPRSKRWDIMDAMSYIVEMLDLGDRYFTPEYGDEYDIEDEFLELEAQYPKEPKLPDWRFI